MKDLSLLDITRERRNELLRDYYSQGYTYSEIAKATGLTYDTVRGVLRNEPKPKQNLTRFSSELSELHELMGISTATQDQRDEPVTENSSHDYGKDFAEADEHLVPPAEPKNVKWVANNTMVNIVINGEVVNADYTHPSFKEIIAACLAEDFEKAIYLANTGKTIEKWSLGAFEFKNGKLYYCGETLHGSLIEKIIKSIQEGDQNVNKYVFFLEDALRNDKNYYNEMWDFIKHNDIKIHDNGAIIGYKKVTVGADGKLYDSYTNTVPNDPGTLVQMPRHLVNDNKSETCSYGLHVGSIDYVRNFSGNQIVKVLVAPGCVVSVPTDYNGQKMRCSEYFVLEKLKYVDNELTTMEKETRCLRVATVNREGLYSVEEVKEGYSVKEVK